MPSYNRVIIMGNLTRDPEVKFINSGTAVCEICLAVNRTWNDEGEKKEETTFVDVTLWGKTAELAGKYLAKGKPVLIEGRLTTDSWEDKQTGQKRTKLKVTGEQMQFIGSGDSSESRQPAPAPRQEQRPAPPTSRPGRFARPAPPQQPDDGEDYKF